MESRRGTGFFAELRRRHVVRTALAYAAVIFVLLQLGEIVFPAFMDTTMSDALIRIVVVGGVLLFPVVLIVAWVYEITPMGIRSMAELDQEAGIDSSMSFAHSAAFVGVTVATVAGAGFWWYQTADGVPELMNFSASSVFQGASTLDAEGPIGSLAVLPLDDLSAEPGQEYFAPGMHEAIVSELSQIGSLRVISRTSVVQYSPDGKSTPQIGRDLGVDAIVEGSVLRAEGQVRITVQLIHAASDTHLWAESYERDLRDIISLQREVAEAITREIQKRIEERSDPSAAGSGPRLAGGDPGGDPAVEGDPAVQDTGTGANAEEVGSPVTPPAPTEFSEVPRAAFVTGDDPAILQTGGDQVRVVYVPQSIEAQEALMKGRMALFGGPEGDPEVAVRYFREAAEADSAFAPAWAGLASTLMSQSLSGDEANVRLLEEARDIAIRAVEVDPTNAEAQEVLRGVQGAIDAIEGNIEGTGVDAPRTPIGEFLQVKLAGLERLRHEEVLLSEQARVRTFGRLLAGRDLEEAAEYGWQLIDEGVDQLVVWEGVEWVLRMEGQAQELIDLRTEREEIRGEEPGPGIRALSGRMRESGADGYWSWKLDELDARASEGESFSWTSLATARIATGDRPGALDALSRAAAERDPLLSCVRMDPVWDVARSDPRFQSILRGSRR